MSTFVALRCPDCKAEISADLRSCIQCGADVGLWPESQRTPLILPGNPALSADVVRKRVSVPKLAVGTVAVAALVGAVLYYMPERDVESLPPLAATAEAAAPDVASRDLAAPPVVEVPLPLPVPADSLGSDAVRADSLAAFSSGDTTLSRSIPRVETAVRPPAPTPAPTPAPRPTPAPATTTAVTTPVTVARPAITPILTLAPLVSSTLRPGERLQLRWTVTDRRTRRPVEGTRVEFTSANEAVANVNPVTGLVLARALGTARIIIDAGTAGVRSVELTVRAPAVAAAVVTPAPPAPDATTAPAPTAAAAPTTAAASVVRDTPRPDLPDAGDVRSVVDRFLRDVPSNAVRNVDVAQFLSDGADHRVTLVNGPTVVSTTGASVRVAFTMRFTKFDGGGRPMSRVAPVTMDVDKRDGQPSSSAVVIGSLRRP
jgi:hypothetical protein